MSTDTSMPLPKGNPPGLYRLFFAEMWERFSFYGMRALLILYMVRQLVFSEEKAYGVYAAYGALVYATPFLGGLLADRFLGYRRSIIIGGLLMAAGQFTLMVESNLFFYTGLALLIVGNGFFKPNISSMVGQLYDGPTDPRRDKGFTIFYMGINLGAFLAPLACGFVGEVYGWGYGFGLAGVGMLVGQITFMSGAKVFGNKGLPPDPVRYRRALPFILLGILGAIAAFVFIVQNKAIMDIGLPLVGIALLVSLLVIAFREAPIERDRLLVVLIMIVFSTMFWAFFEQAGSSITLFTEKNVNRGGIPTSTFQSVNPLFIVVLAPVFTLLWTLLGRMNREPNAPVKFGLGLIQLGLGFGAFVLGAQMSGDGQVLLLWLILGYLLHTTGELCLSPIGLSLMTKLSPGKIVGLVLGAWFLSSSFAHHIGGFIAQQTASTGKPAAGITYVPSPSRAENQGRVIEAFEEADQFRLALVPTDSTNTDTQFVNVNVKRGQPQNIKMDPVLRQHAWVEPGKTAQISLVSPVIDPENKNSTYRLLPHTPNTVLLPPDSSKGDTAPRRVPVGKAKASGSAVEYASTGVFGTDTLRYVVCDSREEGLCDTLQMVVSVLPPNRAEKLVPYATELNLQTDLVDKEYLLGMVSVKQLMPLGFADFQLAYHPKGSDFKVVVDQAPKSGIVKIAADEEDPRLSNQRSLKNYSSVFLIICLIASSTGVFLLLISPFIKRWMHGIR